LSRYLLDTNVISDPLKPRPSDSLLAWLDDQADEDLFTSSLNLAEIWSGVLELPVSRRRREMETWFTGPRARRHSFAADCWSSMKRGIGVGRLMSDGVKAGRPRSPVDMIVAAVAEANDCILVTDNEKHFAGLKFINPMRAAK